MRRRRRRRRRRRGSRAQKNEDGTKEKQAGN